MGKKSERKAKKANGYTVNVKGDSGAPDLPINVTKEIMEEARARGLNRKEMLALAIQRSLPTATDIMVGDTPRAAQDQGHALIRKNITITAITVKVPCQSGNNCDQPVRWTLPWGSPGMDRVAMCPQHAHEHVVRMMKLEEKAAA
jgi:hypothetical protein